MYYIDPLNHRDLFHTNAYKSSLNMVFISFERSLPLSASALVEQILIYNYLSFQFPLFLIFCLLFHYKSYLFSFSSK
jgi:hypothetical protein